MGMARQSTSRGLYLANRNICYNTDTYDFATFDKEATNGEPPYPVIEINRKGLAYFLNEDQGYKSGISMYGHYIACKCLDISSEEEYMNQYTDIRILTNELEPC